MSKKKSDRNRDDFQGVRGVLIQPLEEEIRQGLVEFVIDTGLQALGAQLEEERTAICGPRYRHDPKRRAYRHGTTPSDLVLGGRKVKLRRPRVRSRNGEEAELPSWQTFSDRDPLEGRAIEQMVLGVSTRHYQRSLESLPAEVEERGVSRSAVSRRFVRATQQRFEELMARSLDDLDLKSLLLDGIEFAGHVVLVAMGIDVGGHKHVLGLQEGASENAASCKRLLANLRQRGLQTNRSILVSIDGSKALRKAVRDVFGDRALVQRCQEHKKRNVLAHLPKGMRASVKRAMNEAYRTEDPKRAQQMLENLARRLETEHPGAGASLREGLEETPTVKRLGITGWLERTLSTTNAIENLLGSCREVAHNVKRWSGGKMVLRWMAAGADEASRGFRRLRGYRDMPKLVNALRRRDEELGIELDEEATAA